MEYLEPIVRDCQAAKSLLKQNCFCMKVFVQTALQSRECSNNKKCTTCLR